MELRTRQVSPESSFIDVVWIRESHQFWQLSGLNMLAYSRSGDLALKLCRWGLITKGFKIRLGPLKVYMLSERVY